MAYLAGLATLLEHKAALMRAIHVKTARKERGAHITCTSYTHIRTDEIQRSGLYRVGMIASGRRPPWSLPRFSRSLPRFSWSLPRSKTPWLRWRRVLRSHGVLGFRFQGFTMLLDAGRQSEVPRCRGVSASPTHSSLLQSALYFSSQCFCASLSIILATLLVQFLETNPSLL